MVDLKFDEMSKYKDKDGYINMEQVITSGIRVEREVRGNDKRIKDWFDLVDGRAMFKSNDEVQCNAHWSELLCCELANQAGLKTAKYDLAKYKGKTGVVTKHMCKPGEELITINELIGSGPTNSDFPDNTDIYYVFHNLEEKLMSDGYDEKTIDSCMLQLRKRFLFDIYVMETDRHAENLSFVVCKDKTTGKPTIRVAPMYDTEAALALYDDCEHMKKVYSSMKIIATVTNMQEPKMCVLPEPDEQNVDLPTNSLLYMLQAQVNNGSYYTNKSEEIWKTTLDFLIEDRRVYDFLEGKLQTMNIKKAIEQVEKEKKCQIPKEVKHMVIACFEDRKNAIMYELGLDLEMDSIR